MLQKSFKTNINLTINSECPSKNLENAFRFFFKKKYDINNNLEVKKMVSVVKVTNMRTYSRKRLRCDYTQSRNESEEHLHPAIENYNYFKNESIWLIITF